MMEKYDGWEVVYKFILNHEVEEVIVSIGEDLEEYPEYNLNVNVWFHKSWGIEFESFTPYIYDTFAQAERVGKKSIKRIEEETGVKASYEGLENC